MVQIMDSNLNTRFMSAKRALFKKLYAFMNDNQREAMFTVNDPLLILAGAGSGKTTVLVNRVAFIVKYGNAYFNEDVKDNLDEQEVINLENAISLSVEDIENILNKYISNPCPTWGVLSITFTNKAAKEMKERLNKIIGDNANEIWAGTFHSICIRILRKYGDRVGYLPGFTIYDSDDVKKILSNCLKQLNIDEKVLPIKSVYNQISHAKDKLLSYEDFEIAAGNDFKLKQISQIYTAYQKILFESNALDFDDIIMQAVKLLTKDEEARNYYQNRFRYVCVDEYQDTNHAQLVLILLLSDKYKNLMVVGDDDQSIYKFRGATIENILDFDKTFKNVKVIKLEQNYRSTQNILGAANAVIRNNFGRRGKELWTEKSLGEKLLIKKLDNQNDEAKYIINKIMDIVIREKRKYSDFAILYRVNAQSNNLETIFAKSGVPYRLLGGIRFYERKEIKDIIAYLCVINNTNDNLRLRRIINEPKRKIGEATVNGIEQIANQEGKSIFDIMQATEKHSAISKSTFKLKEFVYLILKLQEIEKTEKLSTLIEKTIEMTGYKQMLINAGEAEVERLENIQELISNAIEYENNNEQATLAGFLEEVALVADIDNYNEDADAVVLMTIHSSKGLEFPIVFLPGMEDNLFPSMQSIMNPEELEEERRLAYVAITRAKERLFALHVRERLLYGRIQNNQISKFLTEIPEELIELDMPKIPKLLENQKPEKPKKNIMSKEFFKKSDLATNIGRTTGYDRFTSGESVMHITFGKGVIISVKEMGADILYEIIFEKAGIKMLMATYAKLKKVDD